MSITDLGLRRYRDAIETGEIILRARCLECDEVFEPELGGDKYCERCLEEQDGD